MTQRIKISVGDGPGIDPEAIVKAFKSAEDYLRELDLATSKLGHQRVKWRVVSASMSSPMVSEWEPETTIDGVKDPELSKYHDKIAECLVSGAELPSFARPSVLRPLRSFLDVGLNGGGYTSIGGVGSVPLVADRDVSARLSVKIEESEKTPYKLFTSVEGIVRQVTNDTRPKKERYRFQIIDRITGSIVQCDADEETVKRIDGHTAGRVVVYGDVNFNKDSNPVKVVVESYRLIDPDHLLPSIDDIHNLGADITGDLDSDDYIRGLRNAE